MTPTPFRLPACRLPSAPPSAGPEFEPEPAGDEPCGWYDSSFELRRGLRVTEHADLRALARLLPPGWLHDTAPGLLPPGPAGA